MLRTYSRVQGHRGDALDREERLIALLLLLLLLLLARERVMRPRCARLLPDDPTGVLPVSGAHWSAEWTRRRRKRATDRRAPKLPNVSMPESSRFARRFARWECSWSARVGPRC
jgi:hypothetical protein